MRALTSVQPDLLALQETWATSETTQAEVFGAALGLYTTYAASRMPVDSDPDVELGLAVLSLWPLLREQHYRLPSEDAPDTIALLVEIDHPAGRLHFATTCLDWEQDRGSHRLAQAHALGVLLNDPGLGRPPAGAARRRPQRAPGERGDPRPHLHDERLLDSTPPR